ncbi:hypothetical protein OQA88_8204 [Cercophora sp. LCS_1]
MSTHLAPASQPFDRPDSQLSMAMSDTTYHSFHDVDLSESQAAQQASVNKSKLPPSSTLAFKAQDVHVPPEMRRQDSGYESLDRRNSQSSRRDSATPSVSSSTRRRRPRTSTARSSQSGPISHLPRNKRRSISPHRAYRNRQSPPQHVTYFHFPHFTSSEPKVEETELSVNPHDGYLSMSPVPTRSESPTYPPPPQSTTYWTSDRTRRLEYAAIDAASRGVRGWVMRHMVPDCFVPKSKRRIGFEDDRGSVVRYRLELEEGGEDGAGAEKHDRKRRKGWWFSVRRH